MKIALVLAALASTALAQQIPIPAHGSVYNGFSRGFNYTASIPHLITTLDLPTDAYQSGDTAGYGVRVNGVIVHMSAGNVGPVSPGLVIQGGDVVDIVGNWSPAVTGNFTAHNSYGTGAPFASSIIGVAHTLNRTGLQWDVSDPGGATAAWLAPTTGSIGRVLVDCAPLAGTVATVASQGPGCTSEYASFYETMLTAAFDLTDTDITGTNTGAGFVVLTTPGTGPLPVGGVDPAGGTVLVLPDDGQAVAGTLGMSVGSNGWMALGGGNSNGFGPTAAVMLGNPSEAVYTWTDLQPNNSGTVTYEEDVATGQCRVTFDAVNGWNTPDPCFIQIDMNVNTGDWAIRYGVVGFANPEQWLVGYSPAGASADPGSTDISAAGVILTYANDIIPLTLEGIGRPIQGPVAVDYEVTTTNIEAGSLIHIGIIGLNRPGTPLAAVGFGSGDCFLNASLDIVTGVVILPGATETWTGLTLPANNPINNGFVFNLQAATLDLNVLSAAGRTSNGLKCTVGDV